MQQEASKLLTLTHQFENPFEQHGAISPPIYLNSLHVFPTFEAYADANPMDEDTFIYGRVSNPTVQLLEKKIAALEHGDRAIVFASGMAAATAAVLSTCKSGDHIICMRNAYHPLINFLDRICKPRMNIDMTYVTGTSLQELEDAILPNTRLVILESPASIIFTVVDLRAIAEICHKHDIKTYIDNTYSTPLFQNPLDMGIDLVMHTLSKYLGGHSDVIGGVLVSKNLELMQFILRNSRELFGGILGPMNAWLVIRGMRTLAARLQYHQDTAMKIAVFLENHPKVSRVYYSGLPSHPQANLIEQQMSGHSGLMSFELKAPPEDAIKVINNLALFEKGVSWGGFESLALCPLYRATSQELQFLNIQNRGLIRIHCGLEGWENLQNDLAQALDLI